MVVNFHRLKLTIRGNPWSIMLALYILAFFCLISMYYFSSSEKVNYNKYKDYEGNITKQQQAITNNLDKYIKSYSENKINKRDIINELRQGAYKLEKVYSSFSFNKGDENTKSLFIIRKQVMLNIAQIYLSKADALENGTGYNEKADREYIDILMERYNLDESFERQRFNIKF